MNSYLAHTHTHTERERERERERENKIRGKERKTVLGAALEGCGEERQERGHAFSPYGPMALLAPRGKGGTLDL